MALILVALSFGLYGVLNLSKLSNQGNKTEMKYESTGDKPLPQKINLWIKAEGGLYLREEASSKSTILKLIPDGTQLEAIETSGEWYKVSYADKTGWVHKNYTTTQAPAEDPTKEWNNYKNSGFGYSLRFPKDWVVQDYGENPASGSTSYVALGVQLPAQLDPLKLPPVIIRISQKPQSEVEAFYKNSSGSVSEGVTVSGLSATKYTYNSSAGTQMTAYVLVKGSKVYVIEETGGFSEELSGIVGSLNLP